MDTLAGADATSDVTPGAASSPQPRKASGVGSRLIALVGELMIIVGALLGLYVVWQLFYTDIEANSI